MLSSSDPIAFLPFSLHVCLLCSQRHAEALRVRAYLQERLDRRTAQADALERFTAEVCLQIASLSVHSGFFFSSPFLPSPPTSLAGTCGNRTLPG